MGYRGRSEGTCPRCDAPLFEAATRAGTLPQCPTCGGAFVTHAVLTSAHRAVGDLIRARPSAHPVVPLRCPACASPMRRLGVETETGDVALDYCNTHGTWFDGAELTRLIDAATPRAG
jgi:Zn-finger nucleic acid-binding protein